MTLCPLKEIIHRGNWILSPYLKLTAQGCVKRFEDQKVPPFLSERFSNIPSCDAVQLNNIWMAETTQKEGLPYKVSRPCNEVPGIGHSSVA